MIPVDVGKEKSDHWKYRYRRTGEAEMLREKYIAMLEECYPFECAAIIDSLPDTMTDAEILEQMQQLNECE